MGAVTHTHSTMRVFLDCVLLAVSASAAPQLEALRNTLSSVFGDGSLDDYEQVPYEVLGKYEGYELRKYPAVKWACTKLTYPFKNEESGFLQMFSAGRRNRRPENKMFMKLFSYISGANMEDESIDMTIAVLSSLKMGEDNMMTKEMCFYLDSAHQASPPKPTDPKV